MTRCFIKISGPPNQSGPQVFCSPLPLPPLAGLVFFQPLYLPDRLVCKSMRNYYSTIQYICTLNSLRHSLGMHDVFSEDWFVSQRGTDLNTCGDRNVPCRTIRHAVKKSKDGDQIYIDSANGRPYMECENVTESTCSIELNKTISFHGINGRPTIKCIKSCKLFVIKNSNCMKLPKVGFYNLVLTSTDTVAECSEAGGFELVMENTTIMDNLLGIHSRNSENCFINIHNSTFREKTNWAIWLRCTYLTAHITNSVFRRNPILLQTIYKQECQNHWQTVEVFVRNSIFDSQYATVPADLFSINPYAIVLNISIWDSLFANHLGFSSLLINDHNPNKRNGTYISLRNITVENNLNTKTAAVSLRAIFNKHTHFEVEVLNSLFTNNSAALFVGVSDANQKHVATMKATVIHNNTFTRNFNGEGVLTSVPAIFFNKGKHQMTSCRFYDNKADKSPFSAVVTVSESTTVTFTDCYFENRQTISGATQFYARGQSSVYFRGKNVFNMLALNKGQVIFLSIPFHKEARIIMKNNFKILCPQGYVLKTQKTCKQSEHTMYCTYMFITCEKCPLKTYALKRAQFIYNTSKNVKCMQCPRGGNCVSGIVKARPNFWGYKTNPSITFTQCPPGYCCNSKNCFSYDSCHGNRTGTLCGRCPIGMSDSLFSAQCTSNAECSKSLFIPGALAILVPYLIFFLYHEEIAKIVRKGLFGSLRVFSRRKQTGKNIESNKVQKSGLLKVIFYYYQVVSLLHSTVGPQNESETIGKLRDDVSRLLNMVLVNIPSFSCPVKNLHPVQKAAILHSVGYCLLGMLGIIYLAHVVIRFLLRQKRSISIEMSSLIANRAQQHRSTFTARIASAFTYIFLLMYASSAQLCLSFLHCVPVDREQVLFLDGNIRCYQTFQYYILIYVVSSVFPFCLVPVLGSYLLKMDRISVRQFYVACMFPLPFCCFWSYLILKDHRMHKRNSNVTEESERPKRGTEENDGQMDEGQDSIQYEGQGQSQVHCRNQCNGQCQALCEETSCQRTCSMSDSEETNDHDREVTQIIQQCSKEGRQRCCCQATLHECGGEQAGKETNLSSTSGENTTSECKSAILRVLLGPFRIHKAVMCFPDSVLPWEGCLIFRRLALILVLTFVQDNRLKMMLTLTLCVAILASHTYIKPFARPCDNAIESLSLSTLTVLCGFTLIKSLYNGEDISSSSENPSLLHYFNTFENIVVVAPLVFLVFIVILSVLGRLFLLVRKCLKLCIR